MSDHQRHTYIASDGRRYEWPPPPGWTQGGDGVWSPPDVQPPSSRPTLPPPRGGPSRTGKRLATRLIMVTVGVLIGGGVAIAVGDDDSGSAPSGMTTPTERPDGDGWATTFLLWLPSGSFEHRRADTGADVCAVVGEDSYRVENESGEIVASADSGQSDDDDLGGLSFDLTGVDHRAQDDWCRVRGAVTGASMERVGSTYTVTNGQLAADFSAREFLSGQFDGPDSVRTLEPIG